MAQLNLQRILAEVAVRHRIRMDDKDPALAIVSLNQLVLEQFTAELVERVTSALRDFEASVQKVQTRAGKLVAQEFNERAATLRRELGQDIQAAGSRAADLVYKVQKANSRASLIRWSALGLTSALAIFYSGLWIGAHYLHI